MTDLSRRGRRKEVEEIQLSTSQWKYRPNSTHLSREGQEVGSREFHAITGTCDLFFLFELERESGMYLTD